MHEASQVSAATERGESSVPCRQKLKKKPAALWLSGWPDWHQHKNEINISDTTFCFGLRWTSSPAFDASADSCSSGFLSDQS